MYSLNHSSPLVDTFSALLTPLLGIIATIILVLQYYLQKRRWRLDLYDKRYPVFQATMDYISFVVQHGTLNNDEWFKFLRNSKDKTFLFGKDVQDYIELLYSKGNELLSIESTLANLPIGEERNKLAKKHFDLTGWFALQFTVSKDLFSSYLRISNK